MEDGILRVGGRLERASVSYNARHLVILPRFSPLSALSVREAHKAVGHLGKNSVLAHLRKEYWIIGANSLINQVVSSCVVCRKYKAQRMNQKMADLPEEHVVPTEKPFTHVGMDYFGQFEVKRGRKNIKRYGVIFTCMSSRAVHLEVAYS